LSQSASTLAREFKKYNLHLVRQCEVRWDKNDTEPVDDYKLFYIKGNDNNNLTMNKLLKNKTNSGPNIMCMP
jgi:hypothetical protein